MNNKYTYLNGNVILEDKKGKKYITPNTNNMYDVVKQENYIEIIENKISDVQEEISEDEETIEEEKKTIKRKIITTFLVPIIIGLIASIIAFGLLKIDNYNIFDYKALVEGEQEHLLMKIMHLFNLHSLSSYVGIAFSAISGLLTFAYEFFTTFVTMLEKRVTKLDLIGEKKELEYLKAKKEEAEITLKELKSKSKEIPLEKQPQEFKVIAVNNDLDYETLDEEQENAFNAGINEYQTLKRVRRNKNTPSFR